LTLRARYSIVWNESSGDSNGGLAEFCGVVC
jgi:hypothetical protein